MNHTILSGRPVADPDTGTSQNGKPYARFRLAHDRRNGAQDDQRAAMFIKLNDIVCSMRNVIPVVYRPRVGAISHKLHAPISGWDNDFYALKDWYRDA